MKTVIAMSGGVDSSTAAALLLDEINSRNGSGELVGMTMQLWNQRRLPQLMGLDETSPSGHASGRCCSLDDVYDARQVADFLGIPYYVVNYEKQFEDAVVRPFVEKYLAGETPVPCSLCNTDIKFEHLISTALGVGADRIATGHYARVRRNEQTGRYRLLTGIDPAKDQSYFLFGLTQQQLARSVFPLGELTKEQVRTIAREKRLPVAEKAESQEICFVPSGSYREFIAAYVKEQGVSLAGERSGELVTTDGRVIGRHGGIHSFTIGQRKGLGIAVGDPLYVVDIDPKRNRVVVGSNEDLLRARCLLRDVNWIRLLDEGTTIEARVRIRNRHLAAPARVEPRSNSQALVEFVEPQRAITPGQAAVFYSGDEILGGGWISRVL